MIPVLLPLAAQLSAAPVAPANLAQVQSVETSMAALDSAITFCTDAANRVGTKLSARGKWFSPMGGHDPSLASTNDLPPLIQRFIEYANKGDRPLIVVQLPLRDGSLWLVQWQQLPLCELAVTGVSDPAFGDMIATRLSASSDWQTHSNRPASPNAPLATRVLFKRMPQPTAPLYGIRALVRWLGTGPKTSDAIQLEANFAAGDLHIASATQPESMMTGEAPTR